MENIRKLKLSTVTDVSMISSINTDIGTALALLVYFKYAAIELL